MYENSIKAFNLELPFDIYTFEEAGPNSGTVPLVPEDSTRINRQSFAATIWELSKWKLN